MATESLPATHEAYPIGMEEPILRSDSREISLLVADETLSVTYASRAAGERVTDPTSTSTPRRSTSSKASSSSR